MRVVIVILAVVASLLVPPAAAYGSVSGEVLRHEQLRTIIRDGLDIMLTAPVPDDYALPDLSIDTGRFFTPTFTELEALNAAVPAGEDFRRHLFGMDDRVLALDILMDRERHEYKLFSMVRSDTELAAEQLMQLEVTDVQGELYATGQVAGQELSLDPAWLRGQRSCVAISVQLSP